MHKQQILDDLTHLIAWCESLKELTDDLWFKSFKEGSWGTADVISHFISWDQFLLDYRIPFIIHSEDFPTVKVDTDTINLEASRYAHSGISKEHLINECILIRKKLVSLIESIPAEKFHESISVGNSSYILSDYFKGHIEHDQTHKNQIDAFLEAETKLL